MIDKRFFAFGCSYTEYSHPTWADILGVNFSFYKNYGRAGSSNYFIMSKLIEANQKYKFNSNDVVYVMFTGFSRFSYLKKRFEPGGEYTTWVTDGELENYFKNTKDEATGKFLDGVWSTDLGIYMSYIAISVIKNILENSNAEYKLMLGIDNRDFIERPEIYSLSRDSVEAAKQFYKLLDNPYSLDEWRENNYTKDDWTVWKGGWEDMHCLPYRRDGHPTIKMHYDYVKKYAPHLLTKFAEHFVQKEIELFNNESQEKQGEDYVKRFSMLRDYKDTTFYMER